MRKAKTKKIKVKASNYLVLWREACWGGCQDVWSDHMYYGQTLAQVKEDINWDRCHEVQITEITIDEK